jgi:hypothetical protein
MAAAALAPNLATAFCCYIKMQDNQGRITGRLVLCSADHRQRGVDAERQRRMPDEKIRRR